MSATNPNLRETLNNGVLQQLANVNTELVFGDFLAGIIQKCLGASRIQSKLFTATGATQALTFQLLDMVPPASADYVVLAECETAGVTVDESTKSVTGFTLLGTTNTQVINVIVVDPGPANTTLAVSSSEGNLTVQPVVVLDVVAVEGTVRGRKTLKIGDSNVPVATGEVVWDGNLNFRFASADAVTSAMIVNLPKGSPLVSSMLDRRFGEQY